MRAGELRHRVTIEAPTSTQDAYGEPVPGWAPVATLWTKREDLTGREAFLAQQALADVTTRFTTRHVPGLSAVMRVNDAGTLYDIQSVADPDGRGRLLVILAKRVG